MSPWDAETIFLSLRAANPEPTCLVPRKDRNSPAKGLESFAPPKRKAMFSRPSATGESFSLPGDAKTCRGLIPFRTNIKLRSGNTKFSRGNTKISTGSTKSSGGNAPSSAGTTTGNIQFPTGNT